MYQLVNMNGCSSIKFAFLCVFFSIVAILSDTCLYSVQLKLLGSFYLGNTRQLIIIQFKIFVVTQNLDAI